MRAAAEQDFWLTRVQTEAPFWKKEQTPQGERWVDARETDDTALAKWGVQAGGSNAGTQLDA